MATVIMMNLLLKLGFFIVELFLLFRIVEALITGEVKSIGHRLGEGKIKEKFGRPYKTVFGWKGWAFSKEVNPLIYWLYVGNYIFVFVLFLVALIVSFFAKTQSGCG